MRINRRSLMRVIRNTVTERTYRDRNIVSIYLSGSLLEQDYSLGGTVDIDLFFIHAAGVEQEREIVRLTDEVHLDIAHHDQRDYRQTKELRVHPWMGPTIKDCQIHYDPGHFMDFTQASVRGQFDSPENVKLRARTQADAARKFWFAYELQQPDAGPGEISEYLTALANACNAIASLNGPPLTERRFLLKYPVRLEAVGQPGLFAGLLGLLGAPNIEMDVFQDWLPSWKAAYQALAPAEAPASLHPDRLAYYLRAFDTLLESEQTIALLWPLLRTWTLAVNHLPQDDPTLEGWRDACTQLGLLEQGFSERIEGLDAYLDLVEETLDDWARTQGIL